MYWRRKLNLEWKWTMQGDNRTSFMFVSGKSPRVNQFELDVIGVKQEHTTVKYQQSFYTKIHLVVSRLTWMAVLIAVALFLLRRNNLGLQFQFTWSLMEPQRKKSSSAQPDDLSGKPAGQHLPIYEFETGFPESKQKFCVKWKIVFCDSC